MLTTLIVITIFSAGGMLYLLLRRLRETRMMADGELLEKLQVSRPVFSDFHQYLIIPTINFYRTSVLPAVYKESEKTISRFRINILKIERWLLRLTNYIRGKRKINTNGNTPYWKDINDFKNGLNGDEKKPE
jgi:hypothetical protein